MEDEVTKFKPVSPNTNVWKNEILVKIAKILDLDNDYVRLLISESIGDYTASVSAWKNIIEETKEAGLARILVKNKIVKGGIDSDDEITIRRLATVMESIKDKFSLRDIGIDLARFESEIIRVRRSLLLCASLYSIKIDSMRFGLDFVPTNITSIEQELIDYATRELRQEPLIFELLYATAIGSPEADTLYLQIKRGKVTEFGTFLVSHKLLPDVSFSANLPQLLDLYSSFNLQEISTAFDYYDRLNSLSRNLLIFVMENELGNIERVLTFQDIIRICPANQRASYENGVVNLISELITHESESGKLGSAQHLELSTAAAALFLHVQGDQAAGQLCHSVAYMKFGSRILYEYAELSDESSLSQVKPTLFSAVLNSVKTLTSDRNYNSFVEALIGSVLHVKVSYLLSKQVGEIRDLLEKFETKGFEAEKLAENLKDAIRDVMDKDIDIDTVGNLLVTQVLSAYIVTVPGIRPVISLIDDYLEKAANVLASEKNNPNSKFSNLIMIDKGSGSWTRVGLVPFGMSFEEFSGYFDVAIKKAIEMYNFDNPKSKTFTHYLIRIFPSSDALKVIAQDPTLMTTPLTTVRNLMRDRMPTVDDLKVLSVTQSAGNTRVKLRNVLAEVIDSNKSSILALLGDSVVPLLNQHDWLKDFLKENDIKNTLFESYGVGKLSALAVSITLLATKGDESITFAAFQKHVETAFPSEKELDLDGIKLLSTLIYRALKNIGLVLAT